MKRMRGMRAAMFAGTICGMFALAACSAHTKREWLTFFFDGVPPEKKEGQAYPQPPVAPESKALPTGAAVARKTELEKTIHRPFLNRRCDACHESQFSQKLRGPAGEICLLCHKIIFAKAAFRHAPAEDGSCLGCHNPHESTEKFLLTRKGQQVCRECHDERDIAGAAAHVAIGASPCQSCHDPHGGGNRLFLKTAASPAPAEPVPSATQ
jgi:predicted CXXCH cytochrome family protein